MAQVAREGWGVSIFGDNKKLSQKTITKVSTPLSWWLGAGDLEQAISRITPKLSYSIQLGKDISGTNSANDMAASSELTQSVVTPLELTS